MVNGSLDTYMHRRSRKNFCLQKSRMPPAGLVYLLFDPLHSFLYLQGASMNSTTQGIFHQLSVSSYDKNTHGRLAK